MLDDESQWRLDVNMQVTVTRDDLTPELAAALRNQHAIACDLETTGLDWRRDAIGTFQLYSVDSGAVVVQAGASRPKLLISVLEDAAVKKVFHHAPFDLRFLTRTWSARPNSVRCTKVASKLVDPEAESSEHSLAPLLRRNLGIDLDKGSVRTSDWTQAHLLDEQVAYAANDVRYLLPLLARLEGALIQLGRHDLFEACCAFLPTQASLTVAGYPDVFAY